MNAPLQRQHLIGPAGVLSDDESVGALVHEPQPTASVPAPMTQFDPERLIMFALEKGVPMEQLERLLAMRDKLLAEQAKNAFHEALARFQGRCPIIGKHKKATVKIKDRNTGQDSGREYSYMYAPLEDVIEVAGPLLAEERLSYSFTTSIENRGDSTYLTAVCTLHHIGGHSESSDFTAPIDKGARMNDTQKVASARMYAKRYAFQDATGVITGQEDDDGDSGGAKHGSERRAGGRAIDAEDPTALPVYPDEKFNKNLPGWKALIESKARTLAEIKATVTTRYCFTEPQLQKLNAAAGVTA